MMLKNRSFLIDAAGQSLIATLDQPELPAVEAGGHQGHRWEPWPWPGMPLMDNLLTSCLVDPAQPLNPPQLQAFSTGSSRICAELLDDQQEFNRRDLPLSRGLPFTMKSECGRHGPAPCSDLRRLAQDRTVMFDDQLGGGRWVRPTEMSL